MTPPLFNHSPLEGKKKKKHICSSVECLAREASFHFPLFYFLPIKKYLVARFSLSWKNAESLEYQGVWLGIALLVSWRSRGRHPGEIAELDAAQVNPFC